MEALLKERIEGRLSDATEAWSQVSATIDRMKTPPSDLPARLDALEREQKRRADKPDTARGDPQSVTQARQKRLKQLKSERPGPKLGGA